MIDTTNNNYGTSRPRRHCVFVVAIVVLVVVLVKVLAIAILSPRPPLLSSLSLISSSSSANHIRLMCQLSGRIVVRGTSPGRILAAPRRIVVIDATSGRTIVRSVAPDVSSPGCLVVCGAATGLTVVRGVAPVRGAQPCPHGYQAPSRIFIGVPSYLGLHRRLSSGRHDCVGMRSGRADNREIGR